MKHYRKMTMWLVLLGMLLSGCERPSADAMPTGTASAMAGVDPSLPSPTLTAAATLTITRTPMLTLTPSLTPQPSLTGVPPVDTANLPDVLQVSLMIEELQPIDGLKKRRITGWANGFDGFTWLDSNHFRTFA